MSQRRLWKTVSSTPVSSLSEASRLAACAVVAIGLSTTTATPARSEASAMGGVRPVGRGHHYEVVVAGALPDPVGAVEDGRARQVLGDRSRARGITSDYGGDLHPRRGAHQRGVEDRAGQAVADDRHAEGVVSSA